MKKITILTIVILIITFKSNGQITKGNWLVGGNGSYSTSTQDALGTKNKLSTIELSPNLGFFLFDKFATGLKFNLSHSKYSLSSSGDQQYFGHSNEYVFGPFARYYLLQKESIVNLFVEGNYAYGVNRVKNYGSIGTSRFYKYSFLAGPVVYFNSVVGLEFTVGYNHLKDIGVDDRTRTFQMGLGLQMHLEKEN